MKRPHAANRPARRTGRTFWFSPEGAPRAAWEKGGSSWADAVNRISLTGETLVVDVSDAEDSGDRVERRRVHKAVHANLTTCARRRALAISRHLDGDYMLFRIVPE